MPLHNRYNLRALQVILIQAFQSMNNCLFHNALRLNIVQAVMSRAYFL